MQRSEDRRLKSPPRLVTVLCLIQFFFVIGGTLLSRVTVRAYERFWVDSADCTHLPGSVEYPRFLRAFGLWFLIVPVTWGTVSTLRFLRARSIRPADAVVGIVLTALLGLFFSAGAFVALCLLFEDTLM